MQGRGAAAGGGCSASAAWRNGSLRRTASSQHKVLLVVHPAPLLQSSIEQIGQALLRNTLLTQPDALRRLRQGGAVGAWVKRSCSRFTQLLGACTCAVPRPVTVVVNPSVGQ